MCDFFNIVSRAHGMFLCNIPTLLLSSNGTLMEMKLLSKFIHFLLMFAHIFCLIVIHLPMLDPLLLSKVYLICIYNSTLTCDTIEKLQLLVPCWTNMAVCLLVKSRVSVLLSVSLNSKEEEWTLMNDSELYYGHIKRNCKARI